MKDSFIILYIAIAVIAFGIIALIVIPEAKGSIGVKVNQTECLSVNSANGMYSDNGICYVILEDLE